MAFALFAVKERLERDELGEYAADGPHVERRGIVATTEQQLGRAVPDRCDRRHESLQRITDRAREAKVCDLHDAQLVRRRHDEHVRRLQIAMYDPVAVQKAHAVQQLMHDRTHHVGRYRLATTEVLSDNRVQIELGVVVHQAEIVARRVNSDVAQRNDIRILLQI